MFSQTTVDFVLQNAYVMRAPLGNGLDSALVYLNPSSVTRALTATESELLPFLWFAIQPRQHTGVLASYLRSERLDTGRPWRCCKHYDG